VNEFVTECESVTVGVGGGVIVAVTDALCVTEGDTLTDCVTDVTPAGRAADDAPADGADAVVVFAARLPRARHAGAVAQGDHAVKSHERRVRASPRARHSFEMYHTPQPLSANTHLVIM
jgi:hypothetical protein